jgi:parvulin-like peptidyl-prolyl isomerase
MDLARLDGAKKRLAAGASFAKLARSLSEGPTAVAGGFVGCFDEKALGNAAEPVKAALDALEPGKVSDVIETERGFYLVRDEGQLGSDREARARRALARQAAVEAAADRLAKEFGQALLDAAKSGESLEDAVRVLTAEYTEKWSDGAKASEDAEPAPQADDRRPKIEISAPFTAGTNPLPTALPTVSPAQIAFELDKADSVHPELIPNFDGFAVLQLKEKNTATRAEFDEDKAEILAQLLLGKQNDALVRYMERLREQYKSEIETNAAMVDDKSVDENAEG